MGYWRCSKSGVTCPLRSNIGTTRPHTWKMPSQTDRPKRKGGSDWHWHWHWHWPKTAAKLRVVGDRRSSPTKPDAEAQDRRYAQPIVLLSI